MNIFKKKITLIVDVFPKLRTPKKVVRSMSQKSFFRGAFNRRHGKATKTLLQSERHHFYQIYWLLSRLLSWKKSFLVIWKILRLLVNTLTADDKYSLLNRDNSTEPIQMELSQKEKSCSGSFLAILECILNFEHFFEKGNFHSLCISEIGDSEKQG